MKINFETDILSTKEFTEKDITPEIKQVSQNEYVSCIAVDELNYEISLKRRSGIILKPTDWFLSFTVDKTLIITNKGLATFQKVIDGIQNLIQTVKSIENIQTISFEASKSRVNLEDIDLVKNILLKKYQESPESFEGFQCDMYGDNFEIIGELKIISGEIITNDFTKHQRNLQLGLPTIKHKHINDFIENTLDVGNLLNGSTDGQKLIDYLGIEYKLPKNEDGMRAAELRTDLYERTLKQRFPDYKFERIGNNIKVYLND